jgi:hypothetical protein
LAADARSPWRAHRHVVEDHRDGLVRVRLLPYGAFDLWGNVWERPDTSRAGRPEAGSLNTSCRKTIVGVDRARCQSRPRRLGFRTTLALLPATLLLLSI